MGGRGAGAGAMWFGKAIALFALALGPALSSAHENAERPSRSRGAGSLETCAVTVLDLPAHPECEGGAFSSTGPDHQEAAAVAELRQQYGLSR